MTEFENQDVEKIETEVAASTGDCKQCAPNFRARIEAAEKKVEDVKKQYEERLTQLQQQYDALSAKYGRLFNLYANNLYYYLDNGSNQG